MLETASKSAYTTAYADCATEQRQSFKRRNTGSSVAALDTLLVGRRVGMMHIVCYLRQGDRVFETYWTTRRGVEAMGNSYALLDMTVYGRQETWEDSPTGWPRWKGDHPYRTDGRPIVQWPRVKEGRSDDLGTGRR